MELQLSIFMNIENVWQTLQILFMTISWNWILKSLNECPCGLLTKVLDYDIEISDAKL